jgi:hypothetical protein
MERPSPHCEDSTPKNPQPTHRSPSASNQYVRARVTNGDSTRSVAEELRPLVPMRPCAIAPGGRLQDNYPSDGDVVFFSVTPDLADQSGANWTEPVRSASSGHQLCQAPHPTTTRGGAAPPPSAPPACVSAGQEGNPHQHDDPERIIRLDGFDGP